MTGIYAWLLSYLTLAALVVSSVVWMVARVREHQVGPKKPADLSAFHCVMELAPPPVNPAEVLGDPREWVAEAEERFDQVYDTHARDALAAGSVPTVCGAPCARCICGLAPGHHPPHECAATGACGARWAGTWFNPVVVRAPKRGAALLVLPPLTTPEESSERELPL